MITQLVSTYRNKHIHIWTIGKRHSHNHRGFHGGILMSRKCLFNNQLKVSQAASLQEECLHRGALWRGERGREIHRGGERGEIKREKRLGRKRAGELNEVESRIWHFHRCAQQGVWGGRSLCKCVYVCVRMCVRECAGVCGAAKLATCLSLVVVLVFPFIRPSAAQLPLGAVSLLPCVTVCVRVCVAQVPVGLERLMFLKVHFALSSTFFYIFVLYVLLRQFEWRQEVGQQADGAGEDTRGNFCSNVNRRSCFRRSTATYPSLINRPYSAGYHLSAKTWMSWKKNRKCSCLLHWFSCYDSWKM